MFFLTGCAREHPPGPGPGDETPLRVLRDHTTTESDSGIVRYVLQAKVARFYSGDAMRAETIRVDFHERGRKVSTLTARAGTLDEDGRMRASGDVVVVSEEGYVLRTESLWWDRRKHKIRTDEFFTITKKGETFKGVGLTTGPNLDLVEVDRDAEGTMELEERR